MKTRRLALLAVALAGSVVLAACDSMGYHQQAPEIPKPITCGAGTVDTGTRCENGSCARR